MIRYQVFISSTYQDLRDERDEVIKAVLELGHIPVGMEMFSAADEEQWKLIARQIEQSDYYIVIVAHRYGSMADERSFTEKEYDYAIEKRVPVLGFVIDDSAAWPQDRIEKDPKKVQALNKFKAKVRRKLIKLWSSGEELYKQVAVSLAKEIVSNPRPGWRRMQDSTFSTPASIVVFDEIHSAFTELAAKIAGESLKVVRAELIQHSSERASNFVLALARGGAQIELLLQDPATAERLSPPSFVTRIQNRITGYERPLNRIGYKNDFKLYLYKTPASVDCAKLTTSTGEMILVLGWYAYYHHGLLEDLSECAVGGGENPCIVINSSHSSFNRFDEFFSDLLADCKSQSREPAFHMQDGQARWPHGNKAE